jgi:hypothetical protein
MARRKSDGAAGSRSRREQAYKTRVPPEQTPQKRGQDDAVERFYEEVLSEAERTLLERARGFNALDEEVPLLRVKLRETLGRSTRKTSPAS